MKRVRGSHRCLGVIAACLAGLLATPGFAARPSITPAMRPFVSVDAPVIAFTNARVIDGTGAPARSGQTVIVRDDTIVVVGPVESTPIPAGAKIINLTGEQTIMPGLVQLHEHFYLAGPKGVLMAPLSYPRLFLAAGVTSLRSPGSANNYGDLKIARAIAEGNAVGPSVDLGVYMDVFGAPALKGVTDTEKYLSFWLDSGFTSVKAYRLTTSIPLKTAIEIAHRRGMKVTGHLCAVTYREAADLGIDNIEHGFVMATDFMPDHRHDVCSDPKTPLTNLATVDPDGPAATALIEHLIARKVAITSTLVTIEDFQAELPPQQGMDLLPEVFRQYHEEMRLKERQPDAKGVLHLPPSIVRNSARMELRFLRSGGLLVSGTDPSVPSMGVLAGYGSWRQMEIMVENGFTPLEAIRVSTLNGAIYLNRADRIGSIAVGKQADLLIVDGDPSADISDIRKVTTVFRQGIGYDPVKLRESVRGWVALQ